MLPLQIIFLLHDKLPEGGLGAPQADLFQKLAKARAEKVAPEPKRLERHELCRAHVRH